MARALFAFRWVRATEEEDGLSWLHFAFSGVGTREEVSALCTRDQLTRITALMLDDPKAFERVITSFRDLSTTTKYGASKSWHVTIVFEYVCLRLGKMSHVEAVSHVSERYGRDETVVRKLLKVMPPSLESIVERMPGGNLQKTRAFATRISRTHRLSDAPRN